MKIRRTIFVVLAAAVTLTSAAAAGPDAAKQRVAIVSYGVEANPNAAKFVLTPLQPGPLERDSGTGRAGLADERVVMREGQRVAIYDSIVETFKGKRGTLVIRSRIEYVEAGSGYHVGSGTWKVVRGTGQYAQITGGGRRGDVYLDSGPWSGRDEGFLTLR
jgi:hypothetical protein